MAQIRIVPAAESSDPKLGKYVEVGGFAERRAFRFRFAYRLDRVYATDEDALNIT